MKELYAVKHLQKISKKIMQYELSQSQRGLLRLQPLYVVITLYCIFLHCFMYRFMKPGSDQNHIMYRRGTTFFNKVGSVQQVWVKIKISPCPWPATCYTRLRNVKTMSGPDRQTIYVEPSLHWKILLESSLLNTDIREKWQIKII